MEDIIDIIVTETTNTIEITSQSTDEVIDVNIIDNREDITLNVTPTVVEININSLTGSFGVEWGDITGTLSAQTDLNTALGLKADLVGGKVPSSQLPSYVDDVVEVANYAALPATGETGKIYVTLDTNKIYRWSGSAYVEIVDSAAVWGAITGTLSSQTDLQSALNAKFDDPTGDTTQYIAGDGSLITFPVAGQSGTLVREVRNTTGATLTKGTIVYISGATGNKPTVSKAIATGDSTSAQTFGMCQANIANNSNGYVVCVGDITGLDTSALTEGAQLYLSSTTAGTYTTTKQLAPAHLVYIGVVTRSHPTLGQIEVKIQNGYELDEIHDVAISSVANNQGIFWESSTSLWKNKSIATVLGYTPEQPLTFNSPLSRSTNTVSIPAATSSANGYLTSTDWSTFNGKQAALSGTGFVKISGTTISYDNTTYVDNANNQSIAGFKTFTTGVHANALRFSESGGFANVAGYTQIGGTADYFNFVNGVNSKQATFNYGTGGTGYTYTLPNSNGTLALTSQLSSYLPLSGGTLTGALSGTSATFSSSITAASYGFAIGGFKLKEYTSTDSRNWILGNDYVAFGDFAILQSTTQTSSTYTPRLYIGSAGNVGIGTTSPSEKLSVTNNANSALALLSINNTTAGTSSRSSIIINSDVTSAQLGVVSSTWNADAVINSNETYLYSPNSIAIYNSSSTLPIRFITNSTERMRITSGGNVLVNLTSTGPYVDGKISSYGEGSVPAACFKNAGNSQFTTSFWNAANGGGTQILCQFVWGASPSTVGNITSNGSSVSYNTTSDYRLKEDLKPINGLELVNKIKVYDYKWKASNERMDGVMAHELAEVLPYAVRGEKDGEEMQGVDYSKIVPVMIQAIKELKAELDTLKNK